MDRSHSRRACSRFAAIFATNRRFAFDYLNCISGVDYLHTDEKKAAKAIGSHIRKSSITCSA